MRYEELPSGRHLWKCPYCQKGVRRKDLVKLRERANKHVQVSSGEGHAKKFDYPEDWSKEEAERIGYVGYTKSVEISHITEDAEVVAVLDLFGRKVKTKEPVEKFLGEKAIGKVERKDNKLKVTRKDGTEILLTIPTDLLHEG